VTKPVGTSPPRLSNPIDTAAVSLSGRVYGVSCVSALLVPFGGGSFGWPFGGGSLFGVGPSLGGGSFGPPFDIPAGLIEIGTELEMLFKQERNLKWGQ
jgi:hypothetical protein